jgi:uncharacterized membrane protein YdbT with pleckstrin-like domain
MSTNDDHSQFPGQLKGEVVKFIFRQHPLVMRKAALLGLLYITLGVLPLDFPQVYANAGLASFCLKVALGVPVVVLAWWFYRWVGWYYTIFIVTDGRLVIIKQKGFFNRSVQEWQLNKIYNLNYHINGLQAALFGFGDITAKTAIGEFSMPLIHRPIEIHRKLVEVVRSAGGGLGAEIDNSAALM